MDTYENDNDISELVYTEPTNEKLLSFFFKKGGKVNINNLNWCYLLYSKRKEDLSQFIVNLETAGLIKRISSHEYKVTRKAKWEKIRDNKTLWFVIAIITLIATVLAIK